MERTPDEEIVVDDIPEEPEPRIESGVDTPDERRAERDARIQHADDVVERRLRGR
jgi:hypothetical protein